MAQPGLSTGAKVTEFLSPEQLEASARRSQCGQRASKITGQRFLALGTFGRWRRPKPSLAQLAAKAAQGEQPVAGTPAARDQRRNSRALAFLQELLQSAFPQRHTGDPVCAEALFAPCARGPLAESTGFGLPESPYAST